MSAEASALCNAEYGQRDEQRTNQRNGYRRRRWDTRAGSIDPGRAEAATRQLLPRLAARAAAALGEGAVDGHRHFVRAGRVDPPCR
jgi:hypothetical protein